MGISASERSQILLAQRFRRVAILRFSKKVEKVLRDAAKGGKELSVDDFVEHAMRSKGKGEMLSEQDLRQLGGYMSRACGGGKIVISRLPALFVENVHLVISAGRLLQIVWQRLVESNRRYDTFLREVRSS